MILEAKRPIPEYAIREIEKQDFVMQPWGYEARRCTVVINEDDAVTYIDPECFSFRDVYGECELTQVIKDGNRLPVVVSKYQHDKNYRSFETEAARQQDVPELDRAVILVLEDSRPTKIEE